MGRVIIIGGSDVGISTALRIRELTAEIKPLVITDNCYPNFSICGIPFYLGGEVNHWQDLAHRTEEDIANRGIELLLDTRVQKILPGEKKIVLQDRQLSYDQLVLGTGAQTAVPPVEGLTRPGVFTMRWIEDCRKFDEYLKEQEPDSVVIIGGGYVGLEMSEALVRRGLKVTVVELKETVLNNMDPVFRNQAQKHLEEKGINIVTGYMVNKIEETEGTFGQDKKLKLISTAGREITADTAVISAGADPNTALGREAGLKTGIKGAYKVNKKLETSQPDIYAGGDCAETLHQITGDYTYIALGSVAHKEGRIIGSNICGLKEEFAGSLGTQSIKLFDRVFARTGFNEQESKEQGFSPISAVLETYDHKKYYPPVYKLLLKVTADSNSGHLLGAQITGSFRAEVSKRIDIFAAAIYNEMNLTDFNQLDLSYSPPLSSPWDPVQQVVQKLAHRIREHSM